MARATETVWGYFRAHPVVLLLFLTPGIPEYLSGSSGVNSLILNPALFLFQLAANLGLYGSGALLIYEAKVRWRKGWATVLLLGGAYGILEEGVALSTLFNPKAGPVGNLGIYGHWAGVNWVWAGSIVPFHALFSISLPIALLGAALPETVGKSLLSGRRTALAGCILAVDVLVLMLVVNRLEGFWMGTPVLAGSLVSVGLLVLVARVAPPGALSGSVSRRPSAKSFAAVGAAFFPAVLLSQVVGEAVPIPAALDLALELIVQGLFLLYLSRASIQDDAKMIIPLAGGLVVPIALFGILSELALPLILVVDVAFAFFLRSLWRRPRPGEPQVPSPILVQS